MKFLKFDEIDSTNNYMKEHINDFNNYDIVSAKTQTTGRGRRGNIWLSPEGMALFSFLLKPNKKKEIEEYTKLPLLAGISTLSALRKFKEDVFSFKWTNDVFYQNKKISGILVEKIDEAFIIGIGININNKIPEEIKDIATSLGEQYDIDKIILTVVEEFAKYYEKFENGKWSEILDEINKYNLLKNKKIKVDVRGKIFSGIAKNIAEDGRLEILIEGDLKLFNIGEIRIEKDFLIWLKK